MSKALVSITSKKLIDDHYKVVFFDIFSLILGIFYRTSSSKLIYTIFNFDVVKLKLVYKTKAQNNINNSKYNIEVHRS
mgnify:CR=1 FL=1